jgi:histidyl-tRNA synthetase
MTNDVTWHGLVGEHGPMPMQFDPPSGTRDFLAADVEARERAFATIRSVFAGYGFEPLQTPAFERLDVLLGKYGEEGDKLIFKILRRGEHEASGEADLALRYDLTVPLARVAAAYGSQLPTPYKRYAIGPVWRADRPGRGRYREFIQCDLDTLGSASALADAEVICAVHDALAGVGITGFRVLLNSRHVLAGLLEAFGVPPGLGPDVLITLDKLDKLAPAEITAELAGRGLGEPKAAELVAAMTAPDAAERIRAAIKPSTEGSAGLDEIDAVLSFVAGSVPADQIEFTPRLVRGLSYYTGPIWEVVAPGVPGSVAGGGRYDHLIEQLGGPAVPATGGSLGIERILLLAGDGADRRSRLDVAVPVMGPDYAQRSFALAAAARSAGLRASVYLGSSGKLGRQLKWASDQGARWALIYGGAEREAGTVTVRDMDSGEQAAVPVPDLAQYLARAAAGQDR